MNNSHGNGLTRAKIAIFVVVAGILFIPFVSARGGGQRKILLHLRGTAIAESDIRFALIHHKIARYLAIPHSEIEWQKIPPEETTIEKKVEFGTESLSAMLMWYGTKVIPIHDAVAVEYSTADQRPRFRLIPFELGNPSSTIEVNVPREPPNDAEAWKPPESTGR